MTYTNTFIQVAEDCPVSACEIPVSKGKTTPIHLIQYKLLTQNPYQYNHEELVFAVHVRRQAIPEAEVQDRKDELWAELFQKGHPCLRASSLTKRYGWGAHYNEDGKIALYGMESDTYQKFVQNEDDTVKLLKAMRNKRK
jgi:hypothetical protein